MDSFLPIFAVAALAAGELREWSHYPPAAVCRRNHENAMEYLQAIGRARTYDGSSRDESLMGQEWDAGEACVAWGALLEIVIDGPREKKLDAEKRLIDCIGPEAWARGQWPAVFASSHFARPGSWPAIPVPHKK